MIVTGERRINNARHGYAFIRGRNEEAGICASSRAANEIRSVGLQLKFQIRRGREERRACTRFSFDRRAVDSGYGNIHAHLAAGVGKDLQNHSDRFFRILTFGKRVNQIVAFRAVRVVNGLDLSRGCVFNDNGHTQSVRNARHDLDRFIFDII